MMKKKLFLFVISLIIGVIGGDKIYAQGWNDITATKLTNHDLSSLDGWTATGISGGNTDNAVNVRESFHQTGWSINNPVIELTQSITLNAGKYVITSHAFHRGSGTGFLYVKVGSNDAQTVALPLVGNGEYKTVPDNVTQSAKAFHANTYLSTLEFNVSTDDTNVILGYTGTNTADYDWFIAGPITLYEVKNEISSTYPLEQTQNINRGHGGWTYAGGKDNGNTYYAQVPVHQTYNESNLGTGNIISRSYENLAHGKYEVVVYAQGNCAWNRSDEPSTAPEVYANSVSTEATCIVQNTCSNVPEYTLSDVTVTDGNLSVGVRNTAAGGNWYLFNIKSLKMTEPCIDFIAEELPDGGAMEAGKWYYTDITIAAEDYKATATTLGDIICTDNGQQLISAATGNVTLTSTNNSLLAKRYYVKSSSANNLVVEAASYTYTLGDATWSVNNDEYIQDPIITVTFNSATTNDPDAELALVDGAKAKVNGIDVPLVAVTKGFKLDLGEQLVEDTYYTITIQANKYGYAGQVYNSSLVRTVHTPAKFDGVYYIATNDGKEYISRGGDSNTEAAIDKYGIAVEFTTSADNVTNIKFIDNNKYLFNSSKSVYTDKSLEVAGASGNWTVTLSEGHYTLWNIGSSSYIKPGESLEPSHAYAAIWTDTPYGWTLETPAAHAAKMAALKDANAAAVATSAGLSATTVTALKAIIEGEGWVGKDITLDNAYTATTEKYQDMDGSYESTIVATQDLTELENGIYKVSLKAFHRLAGNDATYELYTNNQAESSAYLWAGNQQLPLPSVMSESRATAYTEGWNPNYAKDGKNYPNSMGAAGQAFGDGMYTIELFAYVSDGTLSLGAEAPGKYANGNWICWKDLKLTLYKEFVGDYTALASAITTAESTYALGFENGKYAPYNNVAALTALAAAKTMNTNQDALSQDEIDAAKTALTGATWTANEGSVECVYNGNFAEGQGSPAANIQQYGWTRTNGWGQFRNDGYGSSTGYYNQPGSLQYGNAGIYTMPLEANTFYKLTFKYASWADDSNDGMTVSVLNGEDGMSATAYEENNTKYTNGYVTKTRVFQTGAAGNYVLTLANSGNTVITGVSIKKTTSITIDENEDYDNTMAGAIDVTLNRTIKSDVVNTLVLPFDLNQTQVETAFGAGSKVYGIGDYAAGSITLTELAGGITANTPCLLKATEAGTSYTFNGTTLKAGTPVGTPVNGLNLVGSYKASITIAKSTESESRYVVSGGKLYYVETDEGDDKATMKGTRAYFQLAGPNPEAKPLSYIFDDDEEPTAIEGIDIAADDYDAIYTPTGVKVESLQKGLNIVVKGEKSYKIFVK